MKSVIVKTKTKPAHIKFDDMVVGTLYRFVTKDEPDETGVVLCFLTDTGRRLIEIVGNDVGFVWGNADLDDEYVFTLFDEAVEISNEQRVTSDTAMNKPAEWVILNDKFKKIFVGTYEQFCDCFGSCGPRKTIDEQESAIVGWVFTQKWPDVRVYRRIDTDYVRPFGN